MNTTCKKHEKSLATRQREYTRLTRGKSLDEISGDEYLFNKHLELYGCNKARELAINGRLKDIQGNSKGGEIATYINQ